MGGKEEEEKENGATKSEGRPRKRKINEKGTNSFKEVKNMCVAFCGMRKEKQGEGGG